MDLTEMRAVIQRHLDAEGAGDVDGAVAVYTKDIDHDVVGFPGSPTTGIPGARAFYDYLTANIRVEGEDITHEYPNEKGLVMESIVTGKVIGTLLGLPGNDRSISFRMLHVFEFTDGLISRENVWLDTAAVMAQLS